MKKKPSAGPSKEEFEKAYKEIQAKAGRTGGQKTLDRHGSEHFARIARMRHRTLKAKQKKNGTKKT